MTAETLCTALPLSLGKISPPYIQQYLKQSFLDRCSSKLHSKLTRENCSDTSLNNLLIFSANFLWILLEKDVVTPKLTICSFFLSMFVDLVRKGCSDTQTNTLLIFSVNFLWILLEKDVKIEENQLRETGSAHHNFSTTWSHRFWEILSTYSFPSFYKVKCYQSII